MTSVEHANALLTRVQQIRSQPSNSTKKSQLKELIFSVVDGLRRSFHSQDHSYCSTALWVLLNIAELQRFNNDEYAISEVFFQSGVHGIVCDILKNDFASSDAVMLQYAQDLGLVLTWENSRIPSENNAIAEIKTPDAINNFKVYRMDEANIKKLKDLFSIDTSAHLAGSISTSAAIHQKRQEKKSLSKENYTSIAEKIPIGKTLSEVLASIDPLLTTTNDFSHSNIDSNTSIYEKLVRTSDLTAEIFLTHEFIRSFFKFRSREELLLLFPRLEDMFSVLDPKHSNLISGDAFSKVLLLVSVSTAKLKEQDVLKYLDCQNILPSDEVNYKEFLISGKVITSSIVVTSQFASLSKLPVTTWIRRQRQITNDPTTYTWKHHVEWFHSRRSAAVIFLMRKAKKYQSRVIISANDKGSIFRFLYHRGNLAKTFIFLRSQGKRALENMNRRQIVKKKLLIRCARIRLLNHKKLECLRYLYVIATYAKDRNNNLLMLHHVEVKRQAQISEKRVVRPRQAKLSDIYRLYNIRKLTLSWLMNRQLRAQAHVNRKLDIVKWFKILIMKQQGILRRKYYVTIMLRSYGNKAKILMNKKRNAISLLCDKAKRVLSHEKKLCLTRESLISIGKKAKGFSESKRLVAISLFHLGKQIIRHFDAQYFLINRAKRTFAYLQHRHDCFKELRDIAKKYSNQRSKQINEYYFLYHRGNRAKSTLKKRCDAHNVLILKAHKAKEATRKKLFATLLLFQTGHYSKTVSYCKQLEHLIENSPTRKSIQEEHMLRFLDELKVIERNDRKHEDEIIQQVTAPRKSTEIDLEKHEFRWKLELRNSLRWAYKLTYCVPEFLMQEIHNLFERKSSVGEWIGIVGFRKVLCGGRMFGVSPHELEMIFSELDRMYLGIGLIPFESLWSWFLVEARKHKQSKFHFSLSDIAPMNERAAYIVMQRLISINSSS